MLRKSVVILAMLLLTVPTQVLALGITTSADAGQPGDTDAQAELSVVTAEDDAADDDGTVSESELDALDQRIAELETTLAVQQEGADRLRLQRQELESQLSQLDEQIAAAQEIIRLQDLQLAQFQASLAQPAAEPEVQAQAEAETETTATGAVAASETEATGQGQPAGGSLADDLTQALSTNGLLVVVAIVLLILLLVALMLRRNRIAARSDADISESEAATLDFSSALTADPEPSDSERKQADAEDDLVDLEFITGDDQQEQDMDAGDIEEVESLSDEDETATKLELAYAYQKMGDTDGAREILREVVREGNDEQVKEAEKLLSTLED